MEKIKIWKFWAVKRGQSSPRKWLFITATFNAILVCFFSGGGAEVRFGIEYQRFLVRFLGIRCDKSKADGRHKVCLEVPPGERLRVFAHIAYT